MSSKLRQIENVGIEDAGASALAVTPSGSFVTLNRKKNIVTEFTADLSALRTVILPQLRDASGLAVDAKNMYVVDTSQRCISVFNSEGEMTRTITKKYLGLPPEQSFVPFALCVADGRILVASEGILILDESASWIISRISRDTIS